MTDAARIVVIGSGFGGSVAAARLVESGLAVTLIERGPWRDTIPVRSMGISKRAPLPQGRAFWRHLLRAVCNSHLPHGRLTLNRAGLFEIHLGRGLNIVCSSSVGGGSHVYSGLNLRPPAADYWDTISPALSAAQMERHYTRILADLGSRPALADDQLPNTLHERFASSRDLDTWNADYELAMGFLFPQTPGSPTTIVNADGVERAEMRPGADGNLGSFGGGKTTLDFAYLAAALKRGLSVLDQCEVRAIRRATNGYQIEFKNHHSGRSEAIAASHVVVAAGTFNTLKLLLGAESSGGLAPMPRLGYQFGGNGDFFGYWKLDEAGRDLAAGMPAHGLLKRRQSTASGDHEAWPLLVEGSLPPPAQLPLGPWAARMLRQGAFVAGMGTDLQDGRVSYRKGRLRVTYAPQNSVIFERIRQAFATLEQYTAKRIYHFKTPITVHPTGGACIGADAATGVIDSNGEVFGNPGLFVADAAALPKPVGGPPSLTIAAWAEHVAESLIADLAR